MISNVQDSLVTSIIGLNNRHEVSLPSNCAHCGLSGITAVNMKISAGFLGGLRESMHKYLLIKQKMRGMEAWKVGWWVAVLIRTNVLFSTGKTQDCVMHSLTPVKKRKMARVSLCIFQGFDVSLLLFTTDKYIFLHVVPITQL